MTAVQPNFTKPVTIQPGKLNKFCRRFELAKIKLSELEPIVQKTEETHTLAGVRVGIDAFHASPRFLRSLMSLFDFTEKIFKYFTPDELFERIIKRHEDKPVQVCIDQKEKAILAVTGSDNHLFPLEKVVDAVQQNEKLHTVRYRPKSGLLEAVIDLPNQWNMRGDSAYQGRMRFSTPVDCWGESRLTLGTIREICSNGAVVTKDVYASKVIVEKEHGTHLRHLLETFRNDRAFAAMQKRLQEARTIQVSAAEYLKASQLFLLHGGYAAEQIVTHLEEFAGYPEQQYRCDSFENIPPARRRDLPVNLSLLNLLNMISEIMTHHQQEDGSDLENFYTALITKKTDLEDVYTIHQPIQDLFFNDLLLEA